MINPALDLDAWRARLQRDAGGARTIDHDGDATMAPAGLAACRVAPWAAQDRLAITGWLLT